MLLRAFAYPSSVRQVDDRRRLRRPSPLRRRQLRLHRVIPGTGGAGGRVPHRSAVDRPVYLPHHARPRQRTHRPGGRRRPLQRTVRR